MTQAKADEELAAMRAVLETLQAEESRRRWQDKADKSPGLPL